MKKKSFSGFFWILVVLAAIFLFFFMRRNVEGFFWGPEGYCPRGDVSKCNPCYKQDGSKVASGCSNPPYCNKCPQGSSLTKPKTTTTPSCAPGYYYSNGCKKSLDR